jgi:predicted transcriptional regulator
MTEYAHELVAVKSPLARTVSRLTLPRLTVEEVAALFHVSPASVSNRSAELRRD